MAGDKEKLLCEDIPWDHCLTYSASVWVRKFPEIHFPEGPAPSLPLSCCRASALKQNREDEESLAAGEPQRKRPQQKPICQQ